MPKSLWWLSQCLFGRTQNMRKCSQRDYSSFFAIHIWCIILPWKNSRSLWKVKQCIYIWNTHGEPALWWVKLPTILVIPVRCQFMSRLFHFHPSSLLMGLERQWKMAYELEPLQAMLNTQTRFQTPEFDLCQLRLL